MKTVTGVVLAIFTFVLVFFGFGLRANTGVDVRQQPANAFTTNGAQVALAGGLGIGPEPPHEPVLTKLLRLVELGAQAVEQVRAPDGQACSNRQEQDVGASVLGRPHRPDDDRHVGVLHREDQRDDRDDGDERKHDVQVSDNGIFHRGLIGQTDDILSQEGLKTVAEIRAWNRAEQGGGMWNNGSSPTLTNCTFSENWAEWGGGGMFNNGASPVVANCVFTGTAAGFLSRPSIRRRN